MLNSRKPKRFQSHINLIQFLPALSSFPALFLLLGRSAWSARFRWLDGFGRGSSLGQVGGFRLLLLFLFGRLRDEIMVARISRQELIYRIAAERFTFETDG